MKNKLFISFISFVLVISIFVCCFSFSASADVGDYKIIDYSKYSNAFISVGVDSNKSIFYDTWTYHDVPVNSNDGLSTFYDLQFGYSAGQEKNSFMTYQYLSTISGTYPNRVWGGRVWFSNNYSGYQNQPLSTFQTAFMTIPRNYTLEYRLSFFLPNISYENALKLQGENISVNFHVGPDYGDTIESKCAVDFIGRTNSFSIARCPYNWGNFVDTEPLSWTTGAFVSVIGSVSFSQRSTINSISLKITGLNSNWNGLLIDRMVLFTNVYDDSILGRVGSFFINIGNTIGGFFSNLWNNLYNSLTNVTDWLYDIWHDMGVWFNGLTTSIGNFFDNLWNNISDTLDNIITVISAPFHSWLEPIINIVQFGVNGFISLAQGIFTLVGGSS